MLIVFFLVLLFPLVSYSQVVERIEIFGLKWTKEEFVREELLIKEGESFSKKKLRKSIKNLLNTHLFLKVVPTVEKGKKGVIVKLKLKEKFPIVPVPKVRVKTDGSYRLGSEIRYYNFLGMGHRLSVGYMRWFKNDHQERNFYIGTIFYRIIKKRTNISTGIGYLESFNHEFTKDGKNLGYYDIEAIKTYLYFTRFLDREKVKRITTGIRPEFTFFSDYIGNLRQYYLVFIYTIDKRTDMVYYTKGSLFNFYIDLAEPLSSTVYTGSVKVSFQNSIKKRKVDTFNYVFRVGTKFGYSGRIFLISSEIPGYISDLTIGKRFIYTSVSYRMAVIDKKVFFKPIVVLGDAFDEKPDNFLLSPGFEIEISWEKLVDGIIRFRIYKGIGYGSDLQTNLKVGFRW
ncbi:MAG: POTRA domain-containing protein [Desulfurobacteriaceae bacterium]